MRARNMYGICLYILCTTTRACNIETFQFGEEFANIDMSLSSAVLGQLFDGKCFLQVRYRI